MILSIILATRDRPEWLPAAVASVMAQDDPRWELVILDNGTSIQHLVPEHPRIAYFHEEADGPAAAYQRALERATGEIVMPLADDDTLAPHAVKTILAGIGDAQWGYAQTAFHVGGQTQFLLGAAPWSLERMRQDYYLGGAVFWRRELTDRLGGFDSAYDGAADYDLYLRFGEDCEPVVLPEVLYLYNDHPDTDSRRRSANQQAKAQAIRDRAPRRKVAVVTPWIGHHELIPLYARAVSRADQVVVIDNGGGPAAQDIGPQALVLTPTSPLGFAASNNLGAMQVGDDIDVILFLNNDVDGSPEWIERLRSDVQDGALYGPSIGQQTLRDIPLPYVEGWCVAATRDTWAEIGEWDAERFPKPYWEDVELSFRALQLGVELKRAPWAIRHIGGVSTSTTPGAWDGFQDQQQIMEGIVDEVVLAWAR